MCLRVQPVCNACLHLAKNEEYYQCSPPGCSSGDVELVRRPLSRMELVSTLCSNPKCPLSTTFLENAASSLQSKVASMQQWGRQRSLMRSRWAPGNNGAQFTQQDGNSLNGDLNAQQQQPLPSIFESARQFCASVNNAPPFPFGSNAAPGGPFTSVSVPLGSGVATGGVASQANSGWSRKITLTVEEGGNVSSSSGGFVDFTRGGG
ncbi:hypothetical protein VSDG_09682 [Cytospora chrysosperma]|uniref:Uncharacterized protein n=1 Tax=Cytospora chrysosperma TaxID=252740 RepID=A0A423V986_CYTCH|nr:hypothetical protein VSDG_09682 [Valsa sordida]